MDKREIIQKAITDIESRWKSGIVARSQVAEITGGALSPKSLANMDSQGIGPSEKFMVGRQVCYPLLAFLKWLEETQCK